MATVAQRLQSERLKYPALLPDEILVLRAWLKLHEQEYDRFDYNVHLGPGQDPGPTFSDKVRAESIERTQLRVDVVAWKGSDSTIIEVKRRGLPSSIGQLLSYKDLWVSEGRSYTTPRLLLVCNTYSPNILVSLKQHNIQLEVLSVNFSELATPKRPAPPE